MKRTGFLYPLMLGAALSLVLASTPLLANPGNGQGEGQSTWKKSGDGQGKEQRGGGQSQGKGQRGQGQDGDDDRYRHESRERERKEYRERDDDREWARRPRVDEREIRDIFRRRQEYLYADDLDSLPPGIRMNLQRGKPLPPGIAKKFDNQVYRDLPNYDGYEWRRVGTDAVLVDLTNEIIYEVIQDILR